MVNYVLLEMNIGPLGYSSSFMRKHLWSGGLVRCTLNQLDSDTTLSGNCGGNIDLEQKVIWSASEMLAELRRHSDS
jgi:hypothetical protein